MSIKSITYELGLKYRKGHCSIEEAGIKSINYKDVELLRKFITEKGKIVPKRITGISASQQKKIAHAIKQARTLALLSFTHEEMVAKQAGSIYSKATVADITHEEDFVDDAIVDDVADVETEEAK